MLKIWYLLSIFASLSKVKIDNEENQLMFLKYLTLFDIYKNSLIPNKEEIFIRYIVCPPKKQINVQGYPLLANSIISNVSVCELHGFSENEKMYSRHVYLPFIHRITW